MCQIDHVEEILQMMLMLYYLYSCSSSSSCLKTFVMVPSRSRCLLSTSRCYVFVNGFSRLRLFDSDSVYLDCLDEYMIVLSKKTHYKIIRTVKICKIVEIAL